MASFGTTRRFTALPMFGRYRSKSGPHVRSVYWVDLNIGTRDDRYQGRRGRVDWWLSMRSCALSIAHAPGACVHLPLPDVPGTASRISTAISIQLSATNDGMPHVLLLRRASPKMALVRHARPRLDVRFSNRPFRVKRFQTIHDCGVNVARGLALLSGLGTKALPSWVSKTRWNNLSGDLAVNVTAGSSGRTNSPHPSSREGHHSTARWSSSVLLLD
jgi:hypothetical protein